MNTSELWRTISLAQNHSNQEVVFITPEKRKFTVDSVVTDDLGELELVIILKPIE
jgi:hypothetical protein